MKEIYIHDLEKCSQYIDEWKKESPQICRISKKKTLYEVFGE